VPALAIIPCRCIIVFLWLYAVARVSLGSDLRHRIVENDLFFQLQQINILRFCLFQFTPIVVFKGAYGD